MNSLATMEPQARKTFLESLTDEQITFLFYDWHYRARPDQLPPGTPGASNPRADWDVWLINAGRGWGKTRVGAEWVRSMACGDTPLSGGKTEHIALVAETAADARDVMVEGISGLLAVHPPDFRPKYEPSKRRLTWPNGVQATTYNAVEPDQLRGPQHGAAWCDEVAKWRYAEKTWDMLEFGLRLGTNPQAVVTTTPRPIKLLRKIMEDPGTVVTDGSTFENAANLSQKFLRRIRDRYEGTRLGEQELYAVMLDELPGALWSRALIDKHRILPDAVPALRRVVVAIDPALKSSKDPREEEEGAETGIIAAGIGVDGRGYVLGDYSCRETPRGWAERALHAFDTHKATSIIAEINQGGEMVAHTIHSIRPNAPVVEVRANPGQGKATRAEPVAALYEKGLISHVGTFSALEDQMTLFTQFGVDRSTTGDRVDGLVWAFFDLFPEMIYYTPPPAEPPAPKPKYRPLLDMDSVGTVSLKV